jgi:hypothetical protein
MRTIFSKLSTHNNARNFRNFVATLVYMVGHFCSWARSLKVLKFQEILGNFLLLLSEWKNGENFNLKKKKTKKMFDW